MTATAAPAKPSVRAALIPVDKVLFHPHNVRHDLGDLRSLSASIRTYGVLQPVAVETYGERFRLRAGHRRTAAARLAGLARIPAVIYPEPLDDLDWLIQSVHENTHRRQLEQDERRRAIHTLRDLGCSWQGIADHFDTTATTARSWASSPADPSPDDERVAGLYEQVAAMTAEGLSAAQIADRISVTKRTVERVRGRTHTTRRLVPVARLAAAIDPFRDQPNATAADVIAAIDTLTGPTRPQVDP